MSEYRPGCRKSIVEASVWANAAIPSKDICRYNVMMLQTAAITLVVSSVLSAVAIVSFSRSIAVAKVLLPCAVAAAVMGALAIILGSGQGGMAVWAILFACGSCSCGVIAMRHLLTRPTRWIHRFVIYTGYAATFAVMGAAALWLEARAASPWLAAGIFLAVYAVGSAGIFLAKTLTVRRAATTMPEYQASLAADQGGPNGQSYW